MKIKAIVGCVMAGLFLSVAGTALFGQNGPSPQGRGYGGPPQSQEERGAGQGWRHGLRDGTRPRSGNGTCSLNNSAQSQK